MFQVILNNAKIISLLFGLFGLFFTSNTLFGLYLNTSIKQEKFEWKKLWSGLKRGIILSVGVVCLVTGVSTLSTVINMAQIIDVPSEIIDGISIVAIGTIIVASTLDYAKQSIEKFKNIINKEENKDE